MVRRPDATVLHRHPRPGITDVLRRECTAEVRSPDFSRVYKPGFERQPNLHSEKPGFWRAPSVLPNALEITQAPIAHPAIASARNHSGSTTVSSGSVSTAAASPAAGVKCTETALPRLRRSNFDSTEHTL